MSESETGFSETQEIETAIIEAGRARQGLTKPVQEMLSIEGAAEKVSMDAVALAENDNAGKTFARACLYEVLLKTKNFEEIRKTAGRILEIFKEAPNTNVQINFGFNLEDVR